MEGRSGSAPSRSKNENLVTIFDAEHETEALVVMGLLNSLGINSAIMSIAAVQDTFPGVGGNVILVRGEDAAEARRVIEDSLDHSS